MNDSPIGVFDSGVGGLTVVKEILQQLPNETIVYFGDTARVPYGNKSKETIIEYSRQIVDFLLNHGVKAIVVACNTASAFALETIKDEISVPIIGVVRPGAYMAANATRNNRIGIIGTEGTVNSGLYSDLLSEYNPDIKVFSKACPLFVPLVEEGMINDTVTDEMIRRYTKELTSKDIDTLVLGCTHYPLLINAIGNILGDTITLVNPAYETAKTLKKELTELDLLSTHSSSEHAFFVSDRADKFKDFACTILPSEQRYFFRKAQVN